MGCSFFEGPEKKVELAVVDDHPPLRALGRSFWGEVVRSADAHVISVVSNDDLDAYLLSESSLFVYDNFVTMITCGQTRMVAAVRSMLRAIPEEAVAVFWYERKNEHFPRRQPTDFLDDALALRDMIEGRAVRFGVEHEHSVQLFHSVKAHQPDTDDRTLEVLMHGIDPRFAQLLHRGADSDGDVASRLGLGPLLRGFEVDSHGFDPVGYSLNAIRGRHYVTLHVTPEEIGSYVSFETNCDFGVDPGRYVRPVVECFRPESFDIVAFDPQRGPLSVEVAGYRTRKHVHEPIAGYHVTFQHLYRPPEGVGRAFPIDLRLAL